MTATSDTHPNLTSAATFGGASSETRATGVNLAGRIFFGTVLSLSAFGLWLIPVETGDSAMQLIKLLVSLAMLALGIMFVFSARATSDMPDIMIDAQARELTLVSRDADGQVLSKEVHKIDDMNEITLRERMFEARDAAGKMIVSLPLPDKATEKALKNALHFGV